MEKKKFDDMRKVLEDQNYEVIKSIGKGAFGEVVLAKNSKHFFIFQKRQISIQQSRSKIKFNWKRNLSWRSISIKKFKSWVNLIIQTLSGMKISLQVIFLFYSAPDFIIIVMEYCEMGNLLTYQAKLNGKTFTLNEALKVIVEVIKGLKCIHEKDFVHRDIKS